MSGTNKKSDGRYAYTGGILLDGSEGMEPQFGKTVLVNGERIEAITDGPAPAGYQKIDLEGRCLTGTTDAKEGLHNEKVSS